MLCTWYLKLCTLKHWFSPLFFFTFFSILFYNMRIWETVACEIRCWSLKKIQRHEDWSSSSLCLRKSFSTIHWNMAMEILLTMKPPHPRKFFHDNMSTTKADPMDISPPHPQKMKMYEIYPSLINLRRARFRKHRRRREHDRNNSCIHILFYMQ